LDVILNRYPQAIAISAKSKEGFDGLAMSVSDALSRSFLELTVETDISNGKLMAFIAARGEVLSTRYSETTVSIHCKLPEKYAGQIHCDEAVITACNGTDTMVEGA